MKTLLVLSLLPGIIFVIYLYRLDKVEKEPLSLILKLLLAGLLSTIAAFFIESIAENILYIVFDYPNSFFYIIEAFVAVGLVEEGCKYFFLKKTSWFDHNFNCAFDGVLYSAVVALGFAMSENVLYAISYGLSTVITRVFTAIPAHLAFGIVMGIFYSNAKMYQFNNQESKATKNLIYAVFVPTLLHGIYDYCLFDGSDWLIILWYVVIVIIYIIVFRVVRNYAKNDVELY